MKMNLPNKLTVLRLCLVPVIIVFGMLPDSIVNFYLSNFICAILFIGTAVTDMLDGKIARKYGLITDFGKFLDPIADKFMVIGTMFVILYRFPHLRTIMIFTLMIVVFRELAVTSMRLVVSTGQNIVIAANYLGKVKTVSQIVFILVALLEEHIFFFSEFMVYCRPLTVASCLVMLIFTVISGINYIKGYWKFLDPTK